MLVAKARQLMEWRLTDVIGLRAQLDVCIALYGVLIVVCV